MNYDEFYPSRRELEEDVTRSPERKPSAHSPAEEEEEEYEEDEEGEEEGDEEEEEKEGGEGEEEEGDEAVGQVDDNGLGASSFLWYGQWTIFT